MKKRSETNILIVDDEPAIRWSLSEFFEDSSFRVTSAESGEEALDLMASSHFDVAIVDLRLPGMSGDAMIVKANEIDSSTRFIIHTGSAGYALAEDLKKIGVRSEDVFLKPQPDLQAIVRAVQKMVSG